MHYLKGHPLNRSWTTLTASSTANLGISSLPPFIKPSLNCSAVDLDMIPSFSREQIDAPDPETKPYQKLKLSSLSSECTGMPMLSRVNDPIDVASSRLMISCNILNCCWEIQLSRRFYSQLSSARNKDWSFYQFICKTDNQAPSATYANKQGTHSWLWFFLLHCSHQTGSKTQPSFVNNQLNWKRMVLLWPFRWTS